MERKIINPNILERQRKGQMIRMLVGRARNIREREKQTEIREKLEQIKQRNGGQK